MTATVPYRSATAFGAALTDRLKSLATSSRYSVSQLRRQFAYDRLLARVFTDPDDGWILKGGVSMLARLPIARHSADVDLVTHAISPAAAFTALRQAANRDLGDFFSFRFDPPRRLVQGVQGIRIATEARLGPRMFERFGVDLVIGTHITGRPETTGPIVPVEIPGLIRPHYRLYPIADSLADKIMAIIEVHNGRPSTRFRDLVDLLLIVHSQPVAAQDLAVALASERFRRQEAHRSQFDVPAPEIWRRGYATIALTIPELPEKTLDRAADTARAFLDPILSGQTQKGFWNPEIGTWE